MSRKNKEAEREQRRKTVAVNLLSGLTYRQMAEPMGVSLGTISNDVKIILGRWRREHAADAERLMEARFDRALNAIWNKVMDGDIPAINAMLKIEDQRAKLGGMYAPVKSEVSGKDGGPVIVVNWDSVEDDTDEG